MFDKVLVANRGEIAIRIFRTLREMGIGSVAVYSQADRDAPFVDYADEAYLIGSGPAAQSYLMSETLVRTALRAGAQAVHPGFGFLAENAPFARACAAAGLVFVGPPPEAIEAMGSKISARSLMEAAGVPVIPGANRPVPTVEEAVEIAAAIGYPVAVKAAAGGGGKGIEIAADEADLRRGYESRPAPGQGLLLGRHRVRGALPGRPPPRRGAGAGRLPRDGRSSGRARLLDPAPPPEDRRGDAVTGGGRAAARPDRPHRRRGRPRSRLRQRRHRGGPAGEGRHLLLPRDEHAAAGRAHHHRDGDRHRPGARAAADRRRRAAVVRAGAGAAVGPLDPVPHQRRGSAARVRAHPRPHHPLPRAGRPRRAGRFRRRRGRHHLRSLRPHDRQADRVGRRPRPRSPADAAGAVGVRGGGRQLADPAAHGDHAAPRVCGGRHAARVRRGRRLRPRGSPRPSPRRRLRARPGRPCASWWPRSTASASGWR